MMVLERLDAERSLCPDLNVLERQILRSFSTE